MTYTVFDPNGNEIETGIIDSSTALAIAEYHGEGFYAADGAGNRVEDQ